MSAPTEVLPGIWQGGAEVLDEDGRWLADRGIRRAVSACPSTPDREHFEVLHIAVRDADAANITQYFEPVVRFLVAARLAGESVYVHCSQGVSRSSALVAAYVMVVSGESAEAALRFLVCRRPAAFPNLGFYHQLHSFGASGASAALRRSLDAATAQPLVRDREEVARVLADPANAAVDVSAFAEYLRQEHPGVGPGTVLLWADTVVARRRLHLRDVSGQSLVEIPAGEVITVVGRGALDGDWEGEARGCRGFFARRHVREADCAESEDEDYYRGSLGL